MLRCKSGAAHAGCTGCTCSPGPTPDHLRQAKTSCPAEGSEGVVEAVAVFDVGKSNAKLALVDLASRAVIGARTTPNLVRRDGPYPHFDVERLWGWLPPGSPSSAAKRACRRSPRRPMAPVSP